MFLMTELIGHINPQGEIRKKFQTSNFQVARQRRDVVLQKSNP
jgi:hypothetical protein